MKKEKMQESSEPKQLTKAELEIMQILWGRKEAFAAEVLEDMPKPKPAYNTVSTVLRVLERKGVVAHKAFGKSHRYYPLIEREDYTHTFMKSVMNSFFGNSLPQMVSFFCQREQLTDKEREELIRIARSASEQE